MVEKYNYYNSELSHKSLKRFARLQGVQMTTVLYSKLLLCHIDSHTLIYYTLVSLFILILS